LILSFDLLAIVAKICQSIVLILGSVFDELIEVSGQSASPAAERILAISCSFAADVLNRSLVVLEPEYLLHSQQLVKH
jgi:hypothetical protein